MKRTKIVCTIGPACAEKNQLLALVRAGMDVARLNFSHNTHAWHGERIDLLREVEAETGRPVAILQDLCGPKLRVGELPQDGVALQNGDRCVLGTGLFEAGPPPHLPVPLPGLLRVLQPGSLVFLDDAQIELVVEERQSDERVVCTVRHGGVLVSRKGITAPGASFAIDALTPKDLGDAAFGLEQNVDFIAVSFVRRATDMAPIRDAITHAKTGTQIIAKIEKPEAIHNLDEIVAFADGLMVARGDLGVEMPLVRVPVLQKEIIRRANAAGKPVITATQMLESMIRAPRPTRAEVSDVANAIFDGTSAVMLSGESAMGRFPVEATATLTAVAQETEPHLPYARLLEDALRTRASDRAGALSQGAVEIASDLDAAAIVCTAEAGDTARLLSHLRPSMPIIAAADRPGTFRTMALLWGVRPLQVFPSGSANEQQADAVRQAVEAGWLRPGQTIVVLFRGAGGADTEMHQFQIRTV